MDDHRIGAAFIVAIGLIVAAVFYFLAPRPGRFTHTFEVDGNMSYDILFDSATGKRYVRKISKKSEKCYEIDILSAAKVGYKERRDNQSDDDE